MSKYVYENKMHFFVKPFAGVGAHCTCRMRQSLIRILFQTRHIHDERTNRAEAKELRHFTAQFESINMSRCDHSSSVLLIKLQLFFSQTLKYFVPHIGGSSERNEKPNLIRHAFCSHTKIRWQFSHVRVANSSKKKKKNVARR